MKSLLHLSRYIYADHCAVSSDNALPLMYCAHKYLVNGLIDACTRYLSDKLTTNNVLQILEHTLLYDATKLEKQCLHFLSIFSTQCLTTFKSNHPARDTLGAIVDCKTLRIAEVELFEACNSWAKAECQKQGIAESGENKRQALGPVLNKIHFCNLTGEEMATVVSPSGLLPVETELEVFRFLNSPKATTAPFTKQKRKFPDAIVKLPERFYTTHEETGGSQPTKRRKRELMNRSGITIERKYFFKFAVLGFVFSHTGDFKIWVNDAFHDSVNVTKLGVKTFLTMPIQFTGAYGEQINISDTNEPAGKCHTELVEISIDKGAKAFASKIIVTKHSMRPLPFKSLVCVDMERN